MKAKSLFIFLFFVLFIAFFVANALSGMDLTPDTPPAPTATQFDALFLTGPARAGGASGGRPCGSAYTVRPGDTLSSIARMCNLPLDTLLAANPTIRDPHLIHPGQVINIYYIDEPAPALPTATTAAAETVVESASAERQAALSVERPKGLVPGGTLHVNIMNLPPSTPVRVGISREGEPPVFVEERTTGEDGGLALQLAIPRHAQTGERWVVTITTTTWPEIVVTAEPFQIE